MAHHTGSDGQAIITTIADVTDLSHVRPGKALWCFRKLQMDNDGDKQHGDPRACASPPGWTALIPGWQSVTAWGL